jgi:hypothetical protein
VNSSYALYATDIPHGFPEVMGGKPVPEKPVFDAAEAK